MKYQKFVNYNKKFYDINIDDKVTITLFRFRQNILIEIVEIRDNKIYGLILTEKFKSYFYKYGQIIEFNFNNILEHIPNNNTIIIYNEQENLKKLKFILFYIKYHKYPNEIEFEELINNQNIILF